MNTIFTLNSLFQNHMMFQADAPIQLFGTCQDDIILSVQLFDTVHRFHLSGNSFLIELPIVPYIKGAFEIEISTNDQSVTLEDCIFGDLYVASGQSNMQFTMNETFEKEIKDDPNIRFYEVPKLPYEGAHLEFPYFYSSNPKWFSCSKEKALSFSTIGYYVATFLHEQLKRPIGIISCNMGDTSIFSWIDQASLKNNPKLKPYLDYYQTEIDKYRSREDYNERYHIQLPRLMEFYGQIDKGIKDGLPSDKAHEMAFQYYPDPYIPMGPKHYNRPSGCFETMVQKIIPFSIKGVLFYQGESDHQNKDLYQEAFKTFIASWRNAFQSKNMPFVYVQIANYAYPGTVNDPIAYVREAQMLSMNPSDGIYMVSAIDLGEENNIHPEDKVVVSNRISQVLLEYIYGIGNHSLSPQYESYEINNQMIEIKIGMNELPLISKSMHNKGFFALTDTNELIELQDVILKGHIITIKNNAKYREIRYGYSSNPEIDIYSANNLPLLPFKIIL